MKNVQTGQGQMQSLSHAKPESNAIKNRMCGTLRSSEDQIAATATIAWLAQSDP